MNKIDQNIQPLRMVVSPKTKGKKSRGSHDGRVRDFQLGGHVSFLGKVTFKRSLKEAGKEGNEDKLL